MKGELDMENELNKSEYQYDNREENVNFVMGCMGDKDISGSLMLMKQAYPEAGFFATS